MKGTPVITLRQLRFLVALAEELNFSRAAEACHVTQPTLSAALKEMEEALGAPLAERTKRSVILTPLGRAVAERARGVLTEVQDIEALAARAAGPLGGDLRLGAIPTVAPFLIPKALPMLRARFPELRLYLREELTGQLLDGLMGGRLDVILAALPFDMGPAVTETLFEDGYQLAAPRDHPIAARDRVRGEALAGRRLLLLERGHCLQRHALSAFPEIELAQDESFAATSLITLIAMVEEGLGVTLLPQIAVDAGLAAGHDLSLAPLEGACPRRVVLAWRRSSAHAEGFQALAEVLREARRRLTDGAAD